MGNYPKQNLLSKVSHGMNKTPLKHEENGKHLLTVLLLHVKKQRPVGVKTFIPCMRERYFFVPPCAVFSWYGFDVLYLNLK